MNLNRRREFTFVSILSIAACIGWNWYAGKDINWDQLNYHFYLPYSLLDGRFSKDLFPASIQSYLNPISYLPFYWMVNGGWHSLAIGSALACIHAFNLIFLYLLCERLLRERQNNSFEFKIAAFVIGVLSPIFWVEVGSSFNDISLCVLTLAAVYVCLGCQSGSDELPGFGQVALSGILMGMVVGLKLTGAVYAVAGVMLFLTLRPLPFFRRLIIYVNGCVFGYLITGGYWAYLLYKEFGNPIFPFYNKIFESPFFTYQNLNLMRFIPNSLPDVMTLPFEMTEPVSWVYTETISPDLRFAALVLLMTGFMAHRLVLRTGLTSHSKNISVTDNINTNLQWRFNGFLFVSVALWLVTSANGRYGLPITLLIGVSIVYLTRILFSHNKAILFCAIFAIFQLGHLSYTADARWAPESWTPSWFELEVPDDLVKMPHLFLSIGLQTNSFIAPFVNNESSFVNIIGQSSIDMKGAAGARLRGLMEQNKGSIRVLLSMKYEQVLESEKMAASVRRLSFSLARFGLQMNPSRCVSFKFRRVLFRNADVQPDVAERNHYWMMSCEAFPLEISPLLEQERQQATRILDAVAATCPSLFKPEFPVVEATSFGFSRHYVGTEFFLTINSNTQQVIATQVHASTDIDFGNVSNWKNGASKDFSCPERRRSSPWFKAKSNA